MGGGMTLWARSQQAKAPKTHLVVHAPVCGKLARMEDIPDPVFAAGIMGITAGIWPTNGRVCAPVGGTVTIASPVMPHALSIRTSDGLEVLLHVGVGTVDMHGKGFDLLCARGDRVSLGDPLLEFDVDRIRAANRQEIVIAIVTNSERFERLELATPGPVALGDPVITARV